MQAQDIMTKNVVSATTVATVEQVAALMRENHISVVPILDHDDTIIGLISEGDLLRRVERAGKINKSWWLSMFSESGDTIKDFDDRRALIAALAATNEGIE